MNPSRVQVVQDRLVEYLKNAQPARIPLNPDDPLVPGSSLTAGQALEVLEDQLRSRLLDVAARELKARDEGYYTISGAGHEQNAIVGTLLDATDPCFLHYRSGGLMMARSRKHPEVDPIRDTLLSLIASSEDPISGGRHKVWGSRRMWVPPQTSTIASHLPKALGMAFHLDRARARDLRRELPEDAIVACSFGDASASHATALSGIHAARYAFRRGNPTPILWVCEDNRVGISVTKPRRWIADSFSGLSQMDYMLARGSMEEVWETVEKAIQICRTRRKPVFLRIPTVRLWGHAGSDVESTYRSLQDIESSEAEDPLLHNLRHLVELGVADPRQILEMLRSIELRIQQTIEEVIATPKLHALSQVVAPLAPYDEQAVRTSATRQPRGEKRVEIFAGTLPEEAQAPAKRTLAAHINAALTDEMLRRPEIMIFGEDVARKGGVYYVTQDLQNRFGRSRVYDTLLDETTILGLAQGAGHLGLLPIPEIQYLAYLHNAIDQLRGEASSLSFFSNGQFHNPMVVRVASFAYQRGFGGHFHNDNAVGALREIPGIVLATPSRGDDAARMLRGVLAMAAVNGRVACFLEPIALYHEKDLYEEGDRAWLFDYPQPGSALLPGEVGIYNEGNADLLIISYANGLRMSLRAARRLEEDHGIRARVLDLRWLAPLPLEEVEAHAQQCGAVLVADECRATGAGVADAILARLAEGGYQRPMGSVRSADSFIPLGPAANLTLLSEEQIEARALELSRRA